jgi:inosine-uridine nucleoside N-ribohydrolase
MNMTLVRRFALELSITLSVYCVPSLPCRAADNDLAAAPRDAIPVIFDTDIGDDIDDTWALVMLLKSPQFDIKLITTTFGATDYRARLVAKLLMIAKRTEIPIGLGEGGRDGEKGSQWPWVQDFRLADYPGKIHRDGVGVVIDVIERSPQPVTVISIGPLQTMAAALERDPRIAPKAAFVGMHGSVRKGYDGGPVCAEYNVVKGAAVARKVLSAPWRQISITPLDTCGLVNLSGERFQALKNSRDPCVQALLENYRIWKGAKTVEEIGESTTLYDAAAVYLANPGRKPLSRSENLSIRVTDDGFTRIDAGGRKMSVATAWTDLDGFRDLLLNTLTGPR